MHIKTKQSPKLIYGDLLNASYSATIEIKQESLKWKTKSFLGTLRSTISLYITSVIRSSYKYNFINTHTVYIYTIPYMKFDIYSKLFMFW